MFIKFETAKLAKEKGYNYIGDFAYNEQGHEISTNSSFYNSRKYPINNVTSQSDLQTWLRKTYKIDIIIFNRLKKKNKMEYFVNVNGYWQRTKEYNYILFDSYEDALELALFKALKLI